MSLYTGIFTNLLIFCNSLTVERCLRIAGGATFERTGSHCRLVARTQSVMIRIVLFNWVSTFFACTLFSQTGAQYSATLYTKARADMRSTFARQPQLVPASLLIILFLVFSLFFTSSRWL